MKQVYVQNFTDADDIMAFKPMLAGTMKDTSKLHFPMLASQKLDGIRATVQGGQLLSRTLKPIPNKFVQELFSDLPNGLDGELIVGDPLASDAYRKTVSLVMSDEKPLGWFSPDAVRLYVFDQFGTEGFAQRLRSAGFAVSPFPHVELVTHIAVSNLEELDYFEAGLLAKGAEGVMLRSYSGPYKQGRSTELEGYLLKVKRFEDSEASVTGFYEEMENTNEKQVNELGRTKRSTEKAGMVPKGTLGGLEVRDLKTGVDFCIGSGFNADQKKELWQAQECLVGRIAKYKYFPTGGKDKPRHPIFLGWRSKEDM
jgi:DNA ligase-1